MNQGFVILLIIGALLAYFVTSFVGDIEESDDSLLTEEKMIKKEDMTYHEKDLIGQTVLIFRNDSFKKKLAIWSRSPLHKEFMNYFPNFLLMKSFINDRIVDKDFQKRLTEKVVEIEDAYLAGEISQMQAKIKLNSISAGR